jgi:hypothetical protein
MSGREGKSRLETFEADYGRDFGWFVEKDDRRVASLADARFEDMFWYSYAVEPLSESAAEREAVFTAEFWAQTGIVYRNRATGEVAPHAFSGGPTPTEERPRILMRALLSSQQPTVLERALLWIRRFPRR